MEHDLEEKNVCAVCIMAKEFPGYNIGSGGKDNGRQIPLEDITIYIYKEELVPYCSVKLALTSNFV